MSWEINHDRKLDNHSTHACFYIMEKCCSDDLTEIVRPLIVEMFETTVYPPTLATSSPTTKNVNDGKPNKLN